MKILLWCILITLWIINYHVWISYEEESKDGNKKRTLLIVSSTLQTMATALVIWLLYPSYYPKHSFWVLLDIPINVFLFYAGSILITGIICGIYKAIGHHYAQKIEKASHYDTLQFRKDIESADGEIEEIFYVHIFYIIMIILTISNYI